MTYQSHDGGKATSDSLRKLERISLPADLKGKRVLDIGCNEGFFCRVAIERGADHVTGIDANERFLNFARQSYDALGIEFQKRTWRDLPDGKFDLVLWLSAMHYEPDPAMVFRQIANRLSFDGLFVLECGVFQGRGKRMVPVGRPRDMPIYPTATFLEEQLKRAGFLFRIAASPEKTPGDEVPRIVYHCRLRRTSVLVFRGDAASGKSSFAELLSPVSTKIIYLDHMLLMLSERGPQSLPICQFLSTNFDKHQLQRIYNRIDREGLTKEYVQILARQIAETDELVIIDGYMTELQVAELIEHLGAKATVWEASRPDKKIFPRPR